MKKTCLVLNSMELSGCIRICNVIDTLCELFASRFGSENERDFHVYYYDIIVLIIAYKLITTRFLCSWNPT